MAARALQGVGGALLTPATLMLVFTTFAPGPERNRATSVWGAVGSAGLAAGSLLGGVLTSAFGWSWVFFVNVPLALIAAFAATRILPADRPLDTGRSFDAFGAAVATIGSTLLVFGLVSGPAKGWGSVEGAGALAVGALLLAVFTLIEKRSADPLVPLKLFRLRGLNIPMLALIVFQASLGGTYYLFTTYLQSVLNYNPFEAGIAFLPPTVICMAVASSGAEPAQQVASALASTCRQIGGALGLAALVAVANAHTGHNPDPHELLGGLRTAGWVAAVGTLGGAFIGLGLKKQPRPAATPAATPASRPEVTDAATQPG